MPIQKKWTTFINEHLSMLKDIQGMYELGDASGEIVYIGSSNSDCGIRSRLYYHKKYKPRSIKYFRFLEAGLFESPLAMEERHCDMFYEKYHRLPRLQKRMPRGNLFLI
jgi:hypothetical protein